ncbi:hemolysin E, chromosomal-like [Bradysia coprophila]|uniref:hemolysin E, chromosomal-like n=1 Tax=Bradysia coprophila TaxID=38358 RepID=UPI00187D9728|nr:hemolysin E, chromosomal-like [Bradysia coprophila]XP_037044800.1 hemolysin E, chromosomal-like [Bradysia coprophila]
MSATVNTTKQGFLIVGKCVEMYNVLDVTVQWDPITETIEAQDLHFANYTIETAQIIGKVKMFTYEAADKYFWAKQRMYEMCNMAKPLIAAYKNLFDMHDPSNFPAQKQLLLKVLDNGMEKMTAADVELEKCATYFDLVAKELTVLLAQLTIDFSPESEYMKSVYGKIRHGEYGAAAVGAVLGPFGLVMSEANVATNVEGRIIPDMQRKFDKVKNFVESLKMQIENTSTDIKNARKKLDLDIEIIRLQSTTTQQTQSSESLDMNVFHDEIIGPVNDYLTHCGELKHKGNN